MEEEEEEEEEEEKEEEEKERRRRRRRWRRRRRRRRRTDWDDANAVNAQIFTNIEVFPFLFLLTHIYCYYKKQYHSRNSTNASNVNHIDTITYMR